MHLNKNHTFSRRALAMLLTLTLCLSLVPSAFAAQQNSYHDPAEHWMQASNRTNELDVNSVVTRETFKCGECGKVTSFEVFRVPEYTRNGQTALSRNVKYSDGTMMDGVGKGDCMDGVPGKDAYYTGYAEVKEDDDEYVSPLDLLFRAMEYENPESVALRQYKVFKQAAGKTAKSILVSAAVRLAPFNLPQIKAVTDHDDMDLYTLGERKCALYAVIPDNDTTFTFLVSLLYSQIFQTLYYCADQIHHGALPCHVHFILDEAPSVNLPGLPRELATMRSRNISCSTIIQNMAQIKELYKDSWETIPGNSDTLLYLGGNEASTHKYISEALGKSTIDTKTHGQTKGRSGSYSTNFQMSGRELLTPDEVRMLDNRYCILFIRGTRPVMDEKYELMEHPAIRYTMDGGGPPYIHHGTVEPPIPGKPLFQIDFDNEKENAAA